jgi:hypothetical protein
LENFYAQRQLPLALSISCRRRPSVRRAKSGIGLIPPLQTVFI